MKYQSDLIELGGQFKKHIKELATSRDLLVTKRICGEEAIGEAVLTFIIVSKLKIHMSINRVPLY